MAFERLNHVLKRPPGQCVCQLVVSNVTKSNVSVLSYVVSFQGFFDRMYDFKKIVKSENFTSITSTDNEIRENYVPEYMNFIFLCLPTVNVVQADDCLHMAIQSRVTEVSSWVTKPRTLHSEASHITVVPDVFS